MDRYVQITPKAGFRSKKMNISYEKIVKNSQKHHILTKANIKNTVFKIQQKGRILYFPLLHTLCQGVTFNQY